MRRSRFLPLLLCAALALPVWAVEVLLPAKEGALRFAVIGDNGTGKQPEYQVAGELAQFRTRFPFDMVLMMGDNLYGGESPADFQKKFETPYKPLLDGGVKFYAALGNHDDPNQRFYKGFNMNGQRYYTFRPKRGIRFFALDSNYMDRQQLEWLDKELAASGSDWKICFFHHPLYSSGKMHGPSVELRKVLEPLFVKYGVSVVLSGHEHFYERIKPQHGIYYFISGAAGELRENNIRQTDLTAAGFDRDRHFLVMEISGDNLYFQAVSRTGETVDSGVIHRPGAPTAAAAGGAR